jgi:hypothetical protein
MLTVVEHVLSAALRATVAADARSWLDHAQALPVDGSRGPLLDAYARAAIHLGRGALTLSDTALRDLRAAAPGVGFERWTVDDTARALILIGRHRHGRPGRPFVDDAVACFEEGDAREQQSWLRALVLWPEAEHFLPYAIDACRSNIVPVFEALACENAYPARHFPERNFNQMVLKALFNSIELSRVVGLASRLNPELTRMAGDYIAERSAAGRTVPADIGLATGEAAKER